MLDYPWWTLSDDNYDYRYFPDNIMLWLHIVLIEIDTDGPHVDGPHDGPRTIQHRIGPHDGPI